MPQVSLLLPLVGINGERLGYILSVRTRKMKDNTNNKY